MRRKIIFFIILIIATAFIFALVDIYTLKSDLFFGKLLSKIIPFPAVYIKGNFISYDDYQTFLKDYKIYFLFDKSRLEESYKNNAVQQLIGFHFVNNLSKQLNIKCDKDKEFNEFKKVFYEKNYINKEAIERLNNILGFNEVKFEKYVVIPAYCREKISDKLFSSKESSNQRKKIDEIYSELVKNPDRFNEYMEKYRDQNLGSLNELSWLPKRDLPDNLSGIIENMKIGDISPVFRSISGYHIYRLNSIVIGDDENFYKFSQIFLKVRSFEDYISEYLLSRKFKILIP